MFLRIVVMAAMIVAVTWVSANAQKGKKTDDVIKMLVKAEKPAADGLQVLNVTLKIEKPWHLYANPVGLEELSAAQTLLSITGAGKPDSARIEYPKGKLIQDATVGNYFVYEGDVVIKATVKRPVGATDPLEVTVKLQACSATTCLPPATLKAKVEK